MAEAIELGKLGAQTIINAMFVFAFVWWLRSLLPMVKGELRTIREAVDENTKVQKKLIVLFISTATNSAAEAAEMLNNIENGDAEQH